MVPEDVVLLSLLPSFAGAGIAIFMTAPRELPPEGADRVRFAMLRSLILLPPFLAFLGLLLLNQREVGAEVGRSLGLAVGMAALSSSLSGGLIIREAAGGISGRALARYFNLTSIALVPSIYSLTLVGLTLPLVGDTSPPEALVRGALVFSALALVSVLSGVLPTRVGGEVAQSQVFIKKTIYAAAGSTPALLGLMLYIAILPR